jgi:hypothetical protein
MIMDYELIYVITSKDNDDMTATTDPKRAYEILKNNIDCYISLVDDVMTHGKVHYSDFVKFISEEKMDSWASVCIMQSFGLILNQFPETV